MDVTLTHLRGRAARCAAALLFAALVTPLTAHASGGIGDLFVSSDAANNITAYDGVTGIGLGVFTNSVLAAGPLGLHWGYGPSAGKVLLGSFSGGVDEFDANGVYIKTYAPLPDWQWAGIYAPNGNAYIGSMATMDVREYDGTTGAFIRVLCPSPGGPADMAYGPNGNLYICEYMGSSVREVDAITGALVSFWNLPVAGARANDIAFLSSPPRILVTANGPDVCFVFNMAHAPIGVFSGSLWGRPHGITISPYTGNILVADGVSTQVSEHDPVTYAEINATWCNPGTNSKIVDLEFRPDEATPATKATWGTVKDRYRR